MFFVHSIVCLQINMVKKRKSDVDFAFDDDTSDSEEEGLKDFQMRVGQLKQSETSPGQDGSDEDNDVEDDEGSDDESDSEEEISDAEIAVKPEFKLSEEKKLKLSRLQEQLADIGGESESESEIDGNEKEEVLKGGVNLQMGDKVDEEEGEDETSEEEGDIESDDDQEAEETDPDQPENKKLKLNPSSNSVETGEAKARKKYQEQLSKMSIEEIQKLKERLGLKLFHQKLEGTAPERGKKVSVLWIFFYL